MRRLDRKKYLTQDEVGRLLTMAHGYTDRAGRQDYAVLILAVNSGLRIGELVALRVGDIKKEHSTQDGESFVLNGVDVWDGKGEISRRIYIADEVAAVIETHCRRRQDLEPLFFHMRKGIQSRFTERGMRYRIKRLFSLAALPAWYCPHSLRHTYAINYLEATQSLEALREQLGHSMLTTTQVYVCATKRELQRNLNRIKPMLASGRARAL